jgi:hypothetical protein
MQLARWYRAPQTRRSNIDDEFRIYTRSENFEGRAKGIGKSSLRKCDEDCTAKELRKDD